MVEMIGVDTEGEGWTERLMASTISNLRDEVGGRTRPIASGSAQEASDGEWTPGMERSGVTGVRRDHFGSHKSKTPYAKCFMTNAMFTRRFRPNRCWCSTASRKPCCRLSMTQA